MQNKQSTSYQIDLQRPKIYPKITSIGYGNPHYNSMLSYKNGILFASGANLRWVNLQKDSKFWNKQIGVSQILQILQNQKYIVVINSNGLITFLQKEDLQKTVYEFYGEGKLTRHSCLTENRLAISSELNEGTDQSIFQLFSLLDEKSLILAPKLILRLEGNYYYPEYSEELKILTLVQFMLANDDQQYIKGSPAPQKQQKRNTIFKFNCAFQIESKHEITCLGSIRCASVNKNVIAYLQSNKILTFFEMNSGQSKSIILDCKLKPRIIEKFEDGFILVADNHLLMKISYNFEKDQLTTTNWEVNSSGIEGSLSLKAISQGIYSFNESGLHFYCFQTKQTITKSIFSITNCGVALSELGDLLAVADFSGKVFIFPTFSDKVLKEVDPQLRFKSQFLNLDPLFSIQLGIPVRTLAWCRFTNHIAIGCVDGRLYQWKLGQQPQLIQQFQHSINILRAFQKKIYAGTSDGEIIIFDSESMKMLLRFKAHHPISYDSERQRQLFGSMKNYAEIWSLVVSPSFAKLTSSNQQVSSIYVISSSEDQTEKVFKVQCDSAGESDSDKKQPFLQHHLKGHSLAVTCIDWKVMNQELGEIYVSCSDDQVIRFRNPNDNFSILFEMTTTTIKEWHTLTYLALEPNGYRVAIGSLTGYLFIVDIAKKEVLFAEKVHLGGIEGLDWVRNTICTCSSDLCLNLIQLN